MLEDGKFSVWLIDGNNEYCIAAMASLGSVKSRRVINIAPGRHKLLLRDDQYFLNNFDFLIDYEPGSI